MPQHSRLQRAEISARIWQPLIEAWSNLGDDNEVVMLTDIVPTGFTDAALGVSAQKRTPSPWVWRRV